MAHFSLQRNCIGCKQTITFDEFLINLPQYSTERALLIWNDDLLSIHCHKCFFNATEKPYLKNRYSAFDSYFGSRWRKQRY